MNVTQWVYRPSTIVVPTFTMHVVPDKTFSHGLMWDQLMEIIYSQPITQFEKNRENNIKFSKHIQNTLLHDT